MVARRPARRRARPAARPTIAANACFTRESVLDDEFLPPHRPRQPALQPGAARRHRPLGAFRRTSGTRWARSAAACACLPVGAARDGLRVAADGLATALCHRLGGRHAGWRPAALRQDAFVRRIRLRLGVGRCLSPLSAAGTTRNWSRRFRSRRPPGRACSRPTTTVRSALLAHARSLLGRDDYSSLHVLFATGGDTALCAAAGMLIRHGVQFHWDNPGYRDFADFLAAFNHDKRKKVKQERRQLAESGITFTRATGRDIAGRGLGVLPRLLRTDLPRPRLDAVPVARILRTDRRDDAGASAARHRRARRPAGLRRPRHLRPRYAVGPLLGSDPSICPACISRPATTRRSSSASSAASRASRAARRASTSSHAA